MWGSSILNEQANCIVKESSERRYVHKSAWTLQGGGAGNGAFSALGLHVECMGATMYGGGEASAGENWSLQDKSPKTHPCGDSADVRFQNCKQIQKQSGRKQEGSLSRKSVKEEKTWCIPELKKSNFGRCLKAFRCIVRTWYSNRTKMTTNRIYCLEAGHLFDIHDMCKG